MGVMRAITFFCCSGVVFFYLERSDVSRRRREREREKGLIEVLVGSYPLFLNCCFK